jgi:hypothetical protein
VEARTTHVLLAIETGSEPIEGSLAAAGEEPRAFHGWIELVEALERLRADAAAHACSGPAL